MANDGRRDAPVRDKNEKKNLAVLVHDIYFRILCDKTTRAAGVNTLFTDQTDCTGAMKQIASTERYNNTM